MGDIAQSYFRKFRYTLDGPLGPLEISAPKGWDEDNKTFKRSPTAHGVFVNLSSNLGFYKGDELNQGGYSYLKNTYNLYGINSVVSLKREEDVGGVWELDYYGFLDYSTYTREEFYIMLKFNESGLYQKLKARSKENIELDRVTTMDGEDIPSLDNIKQTVALDGRTIYFISKLVNTTAKEPYRVKNSGDHYSFVDIHEDYNEVNINHSSLGYYEAICVPITLLSEQEGTQENGHIETVRDYNIKEDEEGYKSIQDTTAQMFYSDSADEGKIKIDIDMDFNLPDGFYNVFAPWKLRVDVVKFKRLSDTTFEYVNHTPIIELLSPQLGSSHSIKYVYEDETELGTSYCLAYHSQVQDTGKFVNINTTKCDILITDPSYYEASQANFLLPHEAMTRVLKIITGEDDALVSTVLGRTDIGYDKDGWASLIGLTNGFWVRLFNDKPIKTSFRDFENSFRVMAQTGYGIQKFGLKEKVVLEHLKYFYQDVVAIPLNVRPSNIIRKVSTDHFFGAVEIGYKYPTGDNLYEEQQGLDEYNIRNNYISIIDRMEKAVEYISQFSTDGYGKEFARRLPITKYPERDTRYDQRIMAMDLKRGASNVFEERKWGDDFIVPSPFNKQTTGVYSPETAVNLRLSPINTLLRWDFWLGSGLQKYPDDYIRYSSSNGNSTLKTQLIGSDTEYAENGTIKNSRMGPCLFNPEIITFNSPIDRDLMKIIQGTTVIDGREVPNYYCLVSFINEDRLLEFGYLMSAKPNGDGSWELLQSTRPPVQLIDEREPVELPTTNEGFQYDLTFDVN